MTNKREELIREARQAVLTMDYERAYQGGLVGRLADALESDAVFEQSLTPTNDDRESESEFAPGECDGSGTCGAPIHVHGCYTPHRSDQCDSPNEYGHIDSESEGKA